MAQAVPPMPEAPQAPRRRSRLWMWVAIGVAAAVVLAGVGVYYLATRPPAISVVTYATSSEMVTLDPSTEFSNSILVLTQVYEGLTRFNPATQTAEPLLATSWTSTPDGLTWTFTLREGVVFHDGTPFNASAVKFSIDRTIRLGAGASFIWFPVNRTEVVGEFQIRFVLDFPAPVDWIASAGYGAWIFSPNTPGATDAEMTAWFNEGHDSGTGPWTINTAQYSVSRVLLDRFPAYWGGWRPGQFDNAVIRVIADPATREASVKAGDVDITMDPPVQDLANLQADARLRVFVGPSYRSMYAFFNSGSGPTANLSVRRALAYAIPYEDVITVAVGGLGSQPRGVIPAGMWGHDPTLPQYEFDLVRAQQLLAQAGYPTGGFTLTLTYTLGDLFEQKFAELYKEQLATLGITLDIQGLPWEAQWARAQAGPEGAQDIFVMYWWPTYITPYDFLWNMFHSASYAFFNLGYYNNSAFDLTIDTASTLEATDRATAWEMYSDSQQMLVDDVPAVGVVDLKNFMLYRAELKGFVDNPAYPLVVFFYELSR